MQPLRIGACLSLSGRYSRFGGQAAAALEIWRDFDGSAELAIEDDESSPRVLESALPRIMDKCDVILGPYSTQLTRVAGRSAVVLVSISVTELSAPRGAETSDEIAARLRARHPEDTALIEQFTTPGGHPAVRVRRTTTQRVNGRDVTTGQAQALVAFSGVGALGVVSGVALDPGDLDRAAVLVTGIAAGLSVTSAPAAA